MPLSVMEDNDFSVQSLFLFSNTQLPPASKKAKNKNNKYY